jgi:3-hydroxybutyryl-CoA dehydrogenase
MKVVVLANDNLREELLSQGLKEGAQVEWLNTFDELFNHSDADVFIDLLFEMSNDRVASLKKLFPKPVIVNSITSIPENFIRINGWPTFLKRSAVEAACPDKKMKANTEKIFSCFNKKTEWTPDIPGFITARVIVMIINEAYFTLKEKVSTKNEIDIAMKLGTNYPYGPFEWSEKIGLKKICELLSELSKHNKRYEPAPLLLKEASE